MRSLEVIVAILGIISVSNCLDNGLALTPPMGWNSWNWFGCGVNETVVKDAADIIVLTGLRDLGYIHVNVDDCWAYNRTKDGVIISDPVTFPSGMKALADYVHSLGLKFGLYSDAGSHTCAGRPGSLGYEAIDAQTYAEWGVDYLKYDNCWATETEYPEDRYPVMRDALNKTGRPIIFSMCEWGVESPWEWAQNVGNSWRTDIDISDNFESFARVLDNQVGLSWASRPGAWNDPDMLEVGNGGMSFADYRAHFAFWCLLKSPLLIGCDLSSMDNETYYILTAEEVIAVSQDPLGIQGDLISQVGPIQIWATVLGDGSRVVIMYNRHTWADYYNSSITVFFRQLGFPQGTEVTVRDLYAQQDVGVFTDEFTTSVITHDVFIAKITPTDEDLRVKYSDWRPWFKYKRPAKGYIHSP